MRTAFVNAVVLVTGGLLAGLMPSKAVAAEGSRPNVVVIVADDLGYNDLGVQGGTEIPTPHIDSIATNGVRFTSGYVTGPVCSPTRAGLLSGRYQQRRGHDFNPGGANNPQNGLSLDEATLADALRSAGYATGAVGKWHLGASPELNPTRRGFDEFVGFLPAAHPYLPHSAGAADGAGAKGGTRIESNRPGKIQRGTETVDEPGYLTDVWAREATSFIDRNKDKPFFLYLAFNAVHKPLEATDKYLSRFPNLSGDRRVYAAMLSALDDAVGDVLRKLRETGEEQDTLIVFVSDNGGPNGPGGNGANNTPLSGRKGTVYEGGVRVPFLVQWPARLPKGAVRQTPVISLDIFPTALAAADAAVPAGKSLDGLDLLPIVAANTEADAEPRSLFWRYGKPWAVRHGKWKLVSYDGQSPAQLFDLNADVAETTDLASTNPQVVASLRQRWEAWDAGNEDPRWGGRNATRKVAGAVPTTRQAGATR